MNYDDARQKLDSGVWHYTTMNDGAVWPIGYCAQRNCQHADKQQAYACYKQYELDTRLCLDGHTPDSQQKCVDCGAWTQGYAAVRGGMRRWDLCDEHRTREVVERLYEVGPCWHT